MLLKLCILLLIFRQYMCHQWAACETSYGGSTNLTISACTGPGYDNTGNPCRLEKGQRFELTITYYLLTTVYGYDVKILDRNTREVFLNENCSDGCLLRPNETLVYKTWLVFDSSIKQNSVDLEWTLTDRRDRLLSCALAEIILT